MPRGIREEWERGVISLLLSGGRGGSKAGDEGPGRGKARTHLHQSLLELKALRYCRGRGRGAWAFVCVRVLQIPQQIWPLRAGESGERADRDRSSVKPDDPRKAVEPVNPESCGRGRGLKGG